MDKLQWTLDSFGEQLNDLSVDLRNEPDDVNVGHLVWLRYLEDSFQSLYWSLEKMKKSLAKAEEQKLSSLVSCGESAEDIAARLVQGNAQTAQDLWQKNTNEPQAAESPETPTINTILAHRSLLTNSVVGISYFVPPGGRKETGITIRTSGFTSEMGSESTP